MDRRKFPLFIDLHGRRVVVCGGGQIAARRVRTLSLFGPEITVIAPEILPEIRALPGVRCVEARCDPDSLPAADFVLAATGDPAVNAAVAAACRARGVPVNNASDQSQCDFQFPAVAVRGDLVAGVNAGGTDHSLVRRAAAAIRKLWEETV